MKTRLRAFTFLPHLLCLCLRRSCVLWLPNLFNANGRGSYRPAAASGGCKHPRRDGCAVFAINKNRVAQILNGRFAPKINRARFNGLVSNSMLIMGEERK